MRQSVAVGLLVLVGCDAPSGSGPSGPDVTADPPSQNVTIMREADQGFIDLVVEGEPPEGTSDLCYSLRVASESEGVYLVSRRLCLAEYGDGQGKLLYVLPCDATTAQGTLTLWLHDPGEAAEDFVNPCPAPTAGDPKTWAGGCVEHFQCLENEDTRVVLSLQAHSR